VLTFRREGTPLPLSRMPRELLEIRDDGTVSRLRPGPADARVREEGTWTVRSDGTALLRWASATALELVDATESELRLREPPPDAPDAGGERDFPA
jgi:hypothetical protein